MSEVLQNVFKQRAKTVIDIDMNTFCKYTNKTSTFFVNYIM